MKKGITPVVAVIMLLLIVISLVGGMFVWMRRTMGGVQQTVGNQTQQQAEQMGQTIRIDTIDCNAADAYIRNTGSNSIECANIKVWDDQDNPPTSPSGTCPLSPGSVVSVSLQSSYSGSVTVTASAPANEDSMTKTC